MSHAILIIEDEAALASALALLVKRLGHAPVTAASAALGLEKLAKIPPVLVILDIGLPDMSGYDLARELRASPGFEGLVLVAVSGWGQQQDRQRSEEAGFALHLVKPVEIKQIELALRSLVR